MRCRWLNVAVVLAALTSSSLVMAQDKATKSPSASSGERKDPEGRTGISPYTEAVLKGNAAHLARDFAAAVASYREAVQLDAQKPLAHYLMAQSLIADGKLQDADQALQSALRFSEKEPVMKAKTLFVIADLRERQATLDVAVEAWRAYQTYVQTNEKSNGYPRTAEERIRAIGVHQELASKYAEVKNRIAQREQETKSK